MIKNALRYIRSQFRPRDFIFYDGTSYVNLVQTLKDHCGELDIRHDIDSPDHVRTALKMADIERRMGWQARYFTPFELTDKEYLFIAKGALIGVHESGFFAWACHLFHSTHGTPKLYQAGAKRRLIKEHNWSYLNPWDLFITDSMGVWSATASTEEIFEHELWDHPMRTGLREALIHCFKYHPARVQLSIHPNPLTWRPF